MFDRLFDRIQAMGKKLEEAFPRQRAWFASLSLSRHWERGAIIGLGTLVVVMAGWKGYDSQTGAPRLLDVLVLALLAALAYVILVPLRTLLLRILIRLPAALWVAVVVTVWVGTEIWGQRVWLNWAFNLGLAAAVVLAGVAVYNLPKAWPDAGWTKRILLALYAVLGVGGVTAVVILWMWPGSPAAELPVTVPLNGNPLDLEDPSQVGPYPVATITYGSGDHRFRREFGKEADLLTEPVNLSAYVSFDDWNQFGRETIYGYDVHAYPVNGLVWYPVGGGPFPLALIVHGNHNMADYSDPGYDYLRELLASRGTICASVDQNFLNGGIFGRASGENDGRAVMLLEHLSQWAAWDRDPDSPFYRKVDLERVALIGHSRGGEAAALAAVFNTLSHFPGNARIRWEYDFGIRAVVAIAPVDQQWMPADHPNPLVDMNYLVIQGSHDADLFYYDGIQQYQRAAFTDPAEDVFKAAVYVYRANHGQFNTTWGARDSSGIKGVFINRKALLPAEDQRQIAKVLTSAFLEDALHGQRGYRAIFEDYRLAGGWLPQTGFITQYEDYGTHIIADYEEDIDPITVTLEGGLVVNRGLTRWRESALRFRDGERQDNHAVEVGWSGGFASYAITLPAGHGLVLSPEMLLVFAAADGRDPEPYQSGLDFSVALYDQFGQSASLKISEFLPLQTQFPAEILRLEPWNEEYFEEASEPVLQSYRIPLALFLQVNPVLSLEVLHEVHFTFDQGGSGIVFLDQIGFDTVP